MDMRDYLRAGYPFIWLRAYEPDRVLIEAGMGDMVKGRELFSWDALRGIRSFVNENGNSGWRQIDDADSPTSPTELPNKMTQYTGSVWLLMNFHWWASEPPVIQGFLNNMGSFKAAGITAVVVSPKDDIPVEMNREYLLLDFELPDRKAIKTVYDDLVTDYKDKITIDEKLEPKVLDAVQGLTLNEAENAFALSIIRNKKFDPTTLLELKAQMVAKNAALTFHRTKFRFRDVGGLEELKSWLLERFELWFDIAPPRGCMLLGIPGTGKSLTAQALANEINWPCLELNFSRVFGSLVGESEMKMRSALATVDAMSPCILYIDQSG